MQSYGMSTVCGWLRTVSHECRQSRKSLVEGLHIRALVWYTFSNSWQGTASNPMKWPSKDGGKDRVTVLVTYSGSSLHSACSEETSFRVTTLLVSQHWRGSIVSLNEQQYTIEVLSFSSSVPNSFTIVVMESSLGIATLLIILPTVWERHIAKGNTWEGSLLHRVVLCGGVVHPLFTYKNFLETSSVRF